ncbi:MAG: 3'-5' exonuclease [Kiritimatiellaeota bacterium]|nr:3'-5' exonuclease [Kiritimatiellota bacterium]
MQLTAIDFETTGHVPGWPNEPWQVGVFQFCGRDLQPATAYESLLRVAPDRPFNFAAPGRHAQMRAELATAPTPHDIWPGLFSRLQGRVLVAHNIATERNLLARIAPLHSFQWIDTLRLARTAYPTLASKALEDLIPALGLAPELARLMPGRQPHDALHDAAACALLLRHLLSSPNWQHLTLDELLVK